MNRKYELAATVWMLASGLLLDTGLNVEAQVLSTQSANNPKTASNAPLSASHKVLGNNAAENHPSNSAKSPPSGPDSRSDIQLAGLEAGPPVSQPNSQNGFAPSPIQQQLEEMYRRDGRPVPQLNFQQTPIDAGPQPPTARSQFQMPGSSPAVMPKGQIQRPTPMSSMGPPNPNAVSPNSKISRTGAFLSRINPFKSRSASTPSQPPAATPSQPPASTPSQPLTSTPSQPPTSTPSQPPAATPSQPLTSTPSQPPASTPSQPPASAPPRMQPQSTLAPNGSGIGGPTQPKPMTFQPAAAPLILPQVSPATNANVAPHSGLSNTLPPVPGDPGFQAKTIQAKPAGSVDDALDNAFTEMEEDAADGKPVDNRKADNSQQDSSPFSGLSLDSQLPISPEPRAAETPVLSGSTNNRDAEKDLPANAEKQDVLLPSETSGEQVSKKAADAKLKRIAERTELQGLKGFCPVALRDEHDLQNALPEHASLFKGRTYYFSSADAKATFDEQPEQYAPIAGGNDVVMLKTKGTKEGSLDFAVWYKDRLYLFTSQKTLEQFIATPSEFVIKD
jgi:YHS domain-containing protein